MTSFDKRQAKHGRQVKGSLGKKIGFISALGGQGTSLSAAYIAKASASSGRSSVLVDTCGFGGTLSYMLGSAEDAVMNINDAASGECLIEDALTDCGDHLRLLPSASFPERTYSPLSLDVRRVIESLSREYDVFADIPSGTVPDCGMAGCFDMFVICSRADVLSLKYASMLCRHIRKAASHTVVPCEIRLLLTRFLPELMKFGGMEDIDRCIDTVGARLLGVLPHDNRALEAVISGQPPDEKCELMRYAADTAARIYGGRVPLDAGRSFRMPF